jgi:serine/threonine protein kinase
LLLGAIVLDRGPTLEPDGTRYALKVLRTEEGKQSYDRFHREVEALKKVDHPGVVKIVAHGGDEAEGLHFYVMEYIEGLQPLKRIVGTSENPFFRDALKSLNIYIRILEALQACEKAGVVHRDLSLGNVMIFPDYQAVKLIDFGCCFIEDGHCITLTDEAAGPGVRGCLSGSSGRTSPLPRRLQQRRPIPKNAPR